MFWPKDLLEDLERFLKERFGHGEMTFGIADLVENLKRLQVDVVAGISPAGIEVSSDYVVDTGRGFALDFELGRELRGQVFVEQLLVPIDLDAK